MAGIIYLVYGLLAYLAANLVIVYAIGFVGGLVVPKGIDDGAAASPVVAVVVNLLLLSLFAVQHSVMARPGFKRVWTRIVPRPAERSTYVLAATAVLALLMWLWQPLPQVVWNVQDPVGAGVLWALFAAGWILGLGSTYGIDHYDLFGVRQVVAAFRGREHQPPPFQTSGPYRYVRHPIMTGFVIAFWATPHMTVGHLLFAAGATGYILVATRLLEERDLRRFLGRVYDEYRERVPMLIPRPWRGGVSAEELETRVRE